MAVVMVDSLDVCHNIDYYGPQANLPAITQALQNAQLA